MMRIDDGGIKVIAGLNICQGFMLENMHVPRYIAHNCIIVYLYVHIL